jgi:hypothetical protein
MTFGFEHWAAYVASALLLVSLPALLIVLISSRRRKR